MLFNSYIFVLAFLPIVLIGYFGLNHFHKYGAAKVFLILASLFFYGYFNWWYLLIIVSSVGFNYLFSQLMLNDKTKNGVRKVIFAIALTMNIGSLFFFKYYVTAQQPPHHPKRKPSANTEGLIIHDS